MARVLVSAEVAEEIVEILSMLKHGNHSVTVTAPRVALAALTDDLLVGVDVQETGYARQGDHLAKLRTLVEFFRIVLAHKPQVVVSGFPMLKHRLAARFLGTRHVVYLRGLMFDSGITSGFSDQLRYGRLGWLFRSRLFNPYDADKVVTVADINRTFVMDRGVDPDKVVVCGPVWLAEVGPLKRGEPRIVILTSAYEAHGHKEAHRSQVRDIAEALSRVEAEVVLRVHPRDNYDYESDERFSSARINRESSATFLDSIASTDLILSPPSTFAFEAVHIGAKVTIFRNEEVAGDWKIPHGSRYPLPTLRDAVSEIGSGLDGQFADLFAPIDPEALESALKEIL